MKLQHKQRLVGGIVLIALAVVVIPFFLGGNDHKMLVQELNFNIPPQPKVAENPQPNQLQVSKTVENTPQQKNQNPSLLTVTLAHQAISSVSEKIRAAKPINPALKTPKSATNVIKNSQALNGFVVQLASFSRLSNAVALVNELKTKGFAAYMQREEIAVNKRVFRVLVGPKQTKSNADILVKRLAQEMNLEGIIVSVSAEIPRA